MTSLILPDVPEEPSGPAPAAVDTPPIPEPVHPAADDTPPDPETFDRAYVEELRQENAKYRTRARDYEQAFEGYDDDTRASWLELARLMPLAESGDEAAQARIQELFGGDDGTADSAPDALSPPEPVDYRAIARAEAEAVHAEREQARQQQEGIAAIRKSGEDLGYAYGSEDYILFVRGANEAVNAGSDDPIAAGDQSVKAYHQAVVEKFLAAKGEQTDNGLQIPAGTGAAPNLATRPWSDDMSESARWKSVGESAMERFRNQGT